jgi:hypothetical protein
MVFAKQRQKREDRIADQHRGCGRGRDHTGVATRCRTRPMADLTRNAAAISITP